MSFRELAAKLAEFADGNTVSAAMYRLADDEGVLVSVTCDQELANMRDEYDRLKATQPSARRYLAADTVFPPTNSASFAASSRNDI